MTYTFSVTDKNGNSVSGNPLDIDTYGNQVTIKANTAGEYKITFSVDDNGETISSSIDLEVTEKQATPLEFINISAWPHVAVTQIELDIDEDSKYGKSLRLNPYALFNNSGYKYEITPDNEGITFDISRANPTIYPHKAGTYELHVWGTSNGGDEVDGTLTVVVTGGSVTPDPINLTFSDTNGTISAIDLKVGDTKDFSVIPATGITDLTWTTNAAYTISGIYPNLTIAANTAGEYDVEFSGKTSDGADATGTLKLNITAGETPEVKTLHFSDWEGEFTTTTIDLGTNTSETKNVTLNPFSTGYNVEITPDDGGLTFVKGVNWYLTATKPGTYTVHVYGISSNTGEEVDGTMTVIVNGSSVTPDPVDLTFSDTNGTISAIDLKVGDTKEFSVIPATGITALTWTTNAAYTISGIYPNLTIAANTAGEYDVEFSGKTTDGADAKGSLSVNISASGDVTYDEIFFKLNNEEVTSITIEKDANAKYIYLLPYEHVTDANIPEIDGLNITVSQWYYFTVSGYKAGTYQVEVFGLRDGKPAKGVLEVIVPGEVEPEELTFSEIGTLTIPADANYATSTFTVDPMADDYVVTVLDLSGNETTYVSVVAEDDHFRITAFAPGRYIVRLSNASVSGFFNLSVKKTMVISEPLEINIPDYQASETITFTLPATIGNDVEWTIINDETQQPATGISIEKISDDTYNITAYQEGDYTVNASSELLIGTVKIIVRKEHFEPITFTGLPESLEIPAEMPSVSAKFSVSPVAPEDDDYTVTVKSGFTDSSFVTVEKSDVAGEYLLNATAEGTYTVTFANSTHKASFSINVTKEQGIDYTPVNFYANMTQTVKLESPTVLDIDDYTAEDSTIRPFNCYIWPNLRNDKTFKAIVRTPDGTVVYETPDADMEDVNEYEHNAPLVVKHGGNTLDITPHLAGEYIVRIVGNHAYNFDFEEPCAGEIQITVTGIELMVAALPSEIYTGETIQLSITPEDGVYTVVSSDTNILNILESDGKFSFETLNPGTANITVTRFVTKEDGSTKTKSVKVPVTVSKIPTTTIYITNQRQTFEPSEDPYSLWIDKEPIGYCQVTITPKNGAPSNGIAVDYGDSGREYILYAYEEGEYDLTFSGKVLSSEGLELKIEPYTYTVKVQNDEFDYNLDITLVDKDGNPETRDEFPMDETIYFTVEPRSEDSNGYFTSYYPSNGVCIYNSETGIYAFDGSVEDLYSIFVYNSQKSGTLNTNLSESQYKGKLFVTVLPSTASVIDFNEVIPAQIKIGEQLNLTVTDNKFALMKDNATFSITENGDRSTGVTVSGSGQSYIMTGNKVGNYRVNATATTFDGITMNKSIRISVIADGTTDLTFVPVGDENGLSEKLSIEQDYYFRLTPAGDYTVTATVTGQSSTDGIQVRDNGDGTFSVKVKRPGKYTLTAEGTTSSTNEPAYGSFNLSADKATIAFESEYIIDHIANNGYDETTGHDMSEYMIEGLGAKFKSLSHISSVVVTPVLDQEWAASYEWNDEKHTKNHSYYHGLWLGNSVLASDNEKLRASFNENDDLVIYANVAGKYDINIRTKSGYYTKDTHKFSVIIEPTISGKLWFPVPHEYNGDDMLVFDESVNLASVQVYTGHWGDIYYKVEKENPYNIRFAPASEDITADMTLAKYSRMNLTDAKAVTVQQKVNGRVTTPISYMLSSGTVTGVETIATDDPDVKYFTIQGLQIACPTEKGIYIRVKNGKSEKFYVR